MDKRKDFKIGVINKSDIYITPMLYETEVALRNLHVFPQNCYKNTFLGDKTTNNIDKIMLLYQLPKQTPEAVEAWNNFEVFLISLPDYVSDYKADKYHRMFVYNIPEKWKEDYNKFIKWKPSTFSKEYKDHINFFYGNLLKYKPDSPILGVLHKTEERFKFLENQFNIDIPRNQEASSVPYWDEEYYQEEYKHKNVLEKQHGEI